MTLTDVRQLERSHHQIHHQSHVKSVNGITNSPSQAYTHPCFMFFQVSSFEEVRLKKFGTLHEFACHPCAGAFL